MGGSDKRAAPHAREPEAGEQKREHGSGVQRRVVEAEGPGRAEEVPAAEVAGAYERLDATTRWIAALPPGPLRDGYAASAVRYRRLVEGWAEHPPSPVQRAFVLRCVAFLAEAVARSVADFSDRAAGA